MEIVANVMPTQYGQMLKKHVSNANKTYFLLVNN